MHSPLQLFCAITHRLLLLHHLINDLAIPTRRQASAREMVRAPPSAAAAVWEDKRPTFEEEEEKNELIELSVIYRAVTSLNGSIPRPSRLAGWLGCLLACLLTGHPTTPTNHTQLPYCFNRPVLVGVVNRKEIYQLETERQGRSCSY